MSKRQLARLTSSGLPWASSAHISGMSSSRSLEISASSTASRSFTSLRSLSLRKNHPTRSNARCTSFWAPSYPVPIPQVYSPVANDHSPQIPYAPPDPSKVGHSEGADALSGEGRRRERKQRYLDSLMDKAGELNLRCSVLDSHGEWTAQEGRFKKAELCKEYDLDPRDLRKLDSLAPNLVPVILTRKTCILISILHIRALIKPDKVIIFDTAGTVESEVQHRFKAHLERNIKAGLRPVNDLEAVSTAQYAKAGYEEDIDQCQNDRQSDCLQSQFAEQDRDDRDDRDVLAYEHRALESILVATANALEEEMMFTRKLVQHLLADLEDDINRENLKRLLHYSRRMVGFQSRARYVKRSVDEILENDEDLSAMYLTSTARGRPRALHDHEQLELLLESFAKQTEEILSEVDTTVANVQSTQEIAELMLDSGRNALLALDIKVSIATLGIGCGALVAGLFGMNLTSHLEDSPLAFYITTTSAGALGLLVFIFGLRTLRRVRRVALSDRGSSASSAKIRRVSASRGTSYLGASEGALWETYGYPMTDPMGPGVGAGAGVGAGGAGAGASAMRARMGLELARVNALKAGGVGMGEKRRVWDVILRRKGGGVGRASGVDLGAGMGIGAPWKWARGKAKWAKE